MNGKQLLIAYIGVFLIGLTVWQHWRDDVKAVLFDTTGASTFDSGNLKWSDPNMNDGSIMSRQPALHPVVPGQTNDIPIIP